MSKKILQEATIRRFMTLASLGAPSNRFIKENFVTEEEDEELDPTADEEPMDDMPPEEEPPAEEPMDDMPPDEGEGEGDMELSDEEAAILVSLGRKLEAAGVEAAPEAGEEEELGEPEEEPLPEPEAEAPPPGEEEPAPEDEEELLEDIEMMEEEDFDGLVNEVMKRVTKRIIRERIKK